MGDWELLQEYAEHRSETAFAELVKRHLNWVYSAARQISPVLSVVGALRHKGRLTDYSYKRQALGKQLKQADQRHATRAVIIQAGGQMVAVKDFSTGQQEDMSLERFLTEA